jgi:hypothetical protein
MHSVVPTDGAGRYTGLALRKDDGDQPRVFGRDALAHNGFC